MKKGEFEKHSSYTYSASRIKCREHLVSFWRDLYQDQVWKYEELDPVELLEKAEIHRQGISEGDLHRANWFWRRRPRVLSVLAWIFWVAAAIGTSLWVMNPFIGVPVLIASISLVLLTIVRSVRWRREYELSVDRLTRTPGNDSAAFDCDLIS